MSNVSIVFLGSCSVCTRFYEILLYIHLSIFIFHFHFISSILFSSRNQEEQQLLMVKLLLAIIRDTIQANLTLLEDLPTTAHHPQTLKPITKISRIHNPLSHLAH